MFGKLISKVKSSIDETEQIDECFYAQVMDELSEGYKDKALVGKAIAQSDGNKEKFNSIYIKLRAKTLQEETIKTNKELQQQKKITYEKEKTLKYSIQKRLSEGYFEHLFKKEIQDLGYKIKFGLGYNNYKKDGKNYYGKVNYKTMKYVLANEENKYFDSFSFEVE